MMQKCEYPDGSDIHTTPGELLDQLGLALRGIFFHDLEDPLHAIQLNYGQTVLWRRWLCAPSCHEREVS